MRGCIGVWLGVLIILGMPSLGDGFSYEADP